MNALADNSTAVNAAGMAFTLLMAALLLVLPRRYAMAPVMILVCYMTMGERVVIVGLNFTMLRILLLFGWLRIITRGEWFEGRLKTVDKLVIAWATIRTINYTLVLGTSAAFINRLGYAYDIFGAYFLFRSLIRDEQDVYRAVRYLALFVVPVALFVVVERATAQNVFAVFGGVPTPELRDGVLRCQGPFSHSILAGTFGATTVPLFVGMTLYRRSSLALSTLAILSATVIVAMAGSSGPVLAYLFGLLSLAAWPLRRRMRMIRWCVVLVLLILQLVMNSPIWFVMARLTVFSGSTGWFRGFLIDMSVRHLGEWWLIGTTAAGSWHYYLLDVTNQYLAEGLSGGLPAMGLFIAILAYTFRSAGQTLHSNASSRKLRYFVWALGAALVAHAISFFSIAYFDQNVIVFYLLLAGIASVGASDRTAKNAQVPTPVDVPVRRPLLSVATMTKFSV